MEEIKTAKNVGFVVVYDDGTVKQVNEGILFEVEDDRIIFHNGTNRVEVLLAVAETAAEIVGSLNLPAAATGRLLSTIVDRVLIREVLPKDEEK